MTAAVTTRPSIKRKTAIEKPAMLDVTDTSITLLVRPESRYFVMPRVPAAQAAGFERHDGGMAILDRDTSEVLALMTIADTSAEAMGKLDQIRIDIDLVNGPIEWTAGDRMVAAAKKFAVVMLGGLFDEAGRPLTDEDLQARAEEINAIMKQRHRAQMQARERTPLPDGNIRVAGPLSFVSEKQSPRRKWLGANYFDVAPATYHDGKIRGLELAKELLAYHRRHRHGEQLARFDRILEAAMAHGSTAWGKKTIGNVADEFVRVVADEAFKFFARHADHGKWLDSKILEAKESKVYWEAKDAQDKAEMIERLRLGRVAKLRKAVAA